MTTLTNKTFTLFNEKKALFSTLWIFAMLNYFYCDYLSNLDASVIKELLSGHIAGMVVNSTFMLSAAVLMEIPTAMVLLSRVLPYRSNRWANIIAGSIMTVVQLSSFFVGSGPTPHYIFYSVIEASCTAFIVWYAWKWQSPAEAD